MLPAYQLKVLILIAYYTAKTTRFSRMHYKEIYALNHIKSGIFHTKY